LANRRAVAAPKPLPAPVIATDISCRIIHSPPERIKYITEQFSQ
jgi:hypothetical protein